QGCVVLSVAAADRGGAAAAVPRTLKMASIPQMPRLGARRRSSRVKADQVAMLTRELAIMIETGVPVSEALKSLEEHAVNPAIARALAETHAELAQGRTMAQAMAAHSRVFPKLYVDMVRTAETGGSLDETLNQ